jgi:hypothetical protein
MSDLKKKYKNMTTANKIIGNIIKNYEIGDDILENKDIIELLQYHPTKKLHIDNIEYLKILSRPPYNKPSIFYKYKDADENDDISWKLCIQNLFGKYTPEKNYTNDVINAFRNESHIGSKKQYFINNTRLKNDLFCGECSNCKIITNDITTDHYPITHKEILDDYIKENNITLSNVEIFENEQNEMRIKNKNIANEWSIYHDSRALYRLLCKSCNSHFGSYGYNQK